MGPGSAAHRKRAAQHPGHAWPMLNHRYARLSRRLKQLADSFASHGAAIAPARALGSLSALVQRESNVLAYIDGFWLTFWLAIIALGFVTFITRAPPGPLKPVPFGAARALMQRFGFSRP